MSTAAHDVPGAPLDPPLRRPIESPRRARVADLVAGAPGWMTVSVVVAVAAAWDIAFGKLIEVPWIFPDELIYAELGRSLADDGSLAIRGAAVHSYPPVYAAVVALAYLVHEDTVQAYALVKAANAVLFSLAAVPTYLLARRVVSRASAVTASALAVIVPSSAYTSLVMTENAFYPAFLVCVLAIVRAAEQPTPRRQLAALACVAGASLIRVQALALLPAYVAATGAIALGDGRGRIDRRRLSTWARTFGPTLVAFGIGAAVAVAVVVSQGGVSRLVGAYAILVHGYAPVGVARWLVYHAGELALYLGFVPVVATAILLPVAWRRDADRELRVVITCIGAVAFFTLLLVAAFSSNDPEPPALPASIHERYTFYVAPLLVIGLLAWIRREMPRPWRSTAAASALVLVLAGVVPYASVRTNAAFEALALVPGELYFPHSGTIVALAAAAAAASLVWLLPRRLAGALVVVVGATFLVVGVVARARMLTISTDARRSSTAAQRNWIDRIVPAGATVTALWRSTGPTDSFQVEAFRRQRALWEAEFFNGRIVRAYSLGGPMYYGLAAPVVRVRSGVLVRAADGAAVAARYVLAPCDVRLAGVLVRTDPPTGTRLYRVEGAIRGVRVTAPCRHRPLAPSAR